MQLLATGAAIVALCCPTAAQCPGPLLLYDARYDHVALDLLLGRNSLAMVGDLDGRDGPDVVFAVILPSAAHVQVFLNSGNGICTRSLYAAPGDQWPTGAALGDVDRDGDLDIIVVRQGPSPPLFLLNDGQGRFTAEPLGTRITDQLLAFSVCCADFDGDGWSDLFIGMQDPGQCRIYLNDRRGGFVDATFTHLPWAVLGCAQSVGASDLDADGDYDVVVAMGGWCGPKQENVVLLNDGRGYLTPVVLGGIRRWSSAIAVGDVNGDGTPDLLFTNGQDPPELWLNHGGGTFTDASASIPNPPFSTFGAALADVDGDGWNDILMGVQRNGVFRAETYRNQRGQGFVLDTTVLQQLTDLQAYYMHATDMDLDGDVDLVVGGHSPPWATTLGLKVFVQSRRHLLPAAAPAVGRAWTLGLWAAPGQITFPFLSGGSASIPLGALGTLGLDPATMVGLPQVAMGACRQTTSLLIPNMPILRGRRIYSQACVLDLAQPSGTRLTNWTVDTIQ